MEAKALAAPTFGSEGDPLIAGALAYLDAGVCTLVGGASAGRIISAPGAGTRVEVDQLFVVREGRAAADAPAALLA